MSAGRKNTQQKTPPRVSSDLTCLKYRKCVGLGGAYTHTYTYVHTTQGKPHKRVHTSGILCEIPAAPRELLREPSALPTHRDSCRIFSTTRGVVFTKNSAKKYFFPKFLFSFREIDTRLVTFRTKFSTSVPSPDTRLKSPTRARHHGPPELGMTSGISYRWEKYWGIGIGGSAPQPHSSIFW